jgi:hypothetical protein
MSWLQNVAVQAGRGSMQLHRQAAPPNCVLAHAVTLLAPGGLVIIEGFVWERVDHAAADFLYDNCALLDAAGLLATEPPPVTCSTPGPRATASSTKAPPCSPPWTAPARI